MGLQGRIVGGELGLSLVEEVWRRLGVGCRRRMVLLLLGWSRRLGRGWLSKLCGWESMG
jgi:hypothetical protein